MVRYLNPKIHPICLRTTTSLRKLRDESIFIMEILEYRKVIYVDSEFLSKVMSVYKDVRREWVRKGRV